MPQKLTVNDYTFYFIQNTEGKYFFKQKRGNVYRKQHGEFQTMIRVIPANERSLIIELFGIASVQNVKTREHTLVYDIFEDLREE